MTRKPKRSALSMFAWMAVALVVMILAQAFVRIIDALNNTSGVLRVWVTVGAVKWVPSVVGVVIATIAYWGPLPTRASTN